MLGTQHLPLFIASGLLLNLMPGPDTLYIVARSIAQGKKAGAVSVLGISSGCAFHTVAAAFGLSAILAASASAFAIVKLAGAGYLCYLGVRLWLDRTTTIKPANEFFSEKLWKVYRQGLVTNVLNPKVALFFLSFLPQFVDPASTHKIVAFLVLGGIFIFNSTIYCLMVAWFASAISERLRQGSSANSIIKRATGALFVGLGVRLAVSK